MYDEHYYEDDEHFSTLGSVAATEGTAQGMKGLAKKGSAGKIAVIVIFSLIALAVIAFLVATYFAEKGAASPIVSSIEELP